MRAKTKLCVANNITHSAAVKEKTQLRELMFPATASEKMIVRQKHESTLHVVEHGFKN